MAVNPMQRKSRNAFLLGILVMLIISAVVGTALYFLVLNGDKETESGQVISKRIVYVAKTQIKSGDTIKNGVNIEKQELPTSVASGLADGAALSEGTTAKIDLPAGTILTTSMINLGQEITSDVRFVEYNMISLPITLSVGNYIDIRLTLPSGQDYIVVSKKIVQSINGDTIGLNLSEDEILTMSSAIIEAYIMKASNIYAIQYVEPGNQQQATPTYAVNNSVLALMNSDANIEATAKAALRERYSNATQTELRNNFIQNEINQYATESKTNIEAGIQEQIEKAKKERETYLSGLTSTSLED